MANFLELQDKIASGIDTQLFCERETFEKTF